MIKKFTIQVTVRILIIILFCVILSYFILQNYWFSCFGLVILIIIQAGFLIKYVNHTNYSLVKFVNALKNEDYSVYFSPTQKGDSFAKVYDDFNLIIKLFKQNKIEKEAQYKYFKYILEHVNLGIISIKKSDLEKTEHTDEILFLNQAACDILQQPKHKYWHRLALKMPWLVQEIVSIKNGGTTLIDLDNDTEHKQLSLKVVEIEMLQTPYLIVSFQDIRSEIEQKEIEAWHNVIRVLAHEMLNSFTPVSSLAATMKSLTEDENDTILTASKLNDEDIQDINMAANTIKRRSDGLLEFVNDYRTISRVPNPNLQKVNVKQFLAGIEVLMSQSLKEAAIVLQIYPVPSNTTILADAKLIEQVLINLIQNSIFALKDTQKPCISISCFIETNKTVIIVNDNGAGIEEEIIDQIFIPFYTTKKNGSGIGLSLSKTILKKHGGNLLVSSVLGQSTTFSLVFAN